MENEPVEVEIIQEEEVKYSKELPEFDLDRLAKEIDAVFQDKMRTNGDLFEKTSVETLEKKNEELLSLFTSYEEQVKKIFPDIKEELLAEIAKGRTVIVLPDAKEVNVLHTDHPEMENVVKSLVLHHKAMLVGPAGTGKTTMVKHISERLNLPFYKYSCSRDSSVHDLIGYKQPQSETYLETVFLKAYEEGGIFLVDEYDAMSGDMALFFNGIADNSDFISIPHRDTKPTATKHKDFFIVICGNTWGKGSTDYSGRDFQDMALMDRFRFCRHHIGYHIELEKELMKEDYSFAVKLRGELESVGSYLSTRNVEDISMLIATDVSIQDIVNMVTQDLSKEDQKDIKSKMPSFLPSKAPVDNWSRSIDSSTRRNGNDYSGNLSVCRHNGSVGDPNIIRDSDGTWYSIERMIVEFPPNNVGAMNHLRNIRPSLHKEYLHFCRMIHQQVISRGTGSSF